MGRTQVFGLACLLLAGCDTRAVDPSTASPVPKNRIYAFGRASAADDARIVFVQDQSGISCFGAGMQIYIDGRLAAETGSGQKVTLYHPSGTAQVSVRNKAMCAGGDLTGLVLELKEGYSYQLRGYRGTWDKPELMLGNPPPFKYVD